MSEHTTLRAELERLEQEAALYHQPDRQRMLTVEQRDILRVVAHRIRGLRQALGPIDD
jgi:hypothetical protein